MMVCTRVRNREVFIFHDSSTILTLPILLLRKCKWRGLSVLDHSPFFAFKKDVKASSNIIDYIREHLYDR